MDDRKIEYIAFESVCARFERINKRLWILCIILAIMLVASIMYTIHIMQEYESVETTVTQDLDSDYGGDAIIYDGVHINDGESEAND